MGELLNNLLKSLFIGIWFLLVAGGLYLSAALWAADTQRDLWSNQYNHAESVAVKKKIAIRYKEWTALRLSRLFFVNPKAIWRNMQIAWPLLKNPVLNIGKGRFWPGNITKDRMVKHIMPPPLIAFLIAGLLQWLAYPVARSKLARNLSTTDKKTFGRIKDLPLGNGFVLAQKVRLAADGGGNPHVLTIGPSGNGKSACQALPSLLSLPDDASCIVTDPKGELLCRAWAFLKKRGHKVYVVGPRTGYGHGWDPVWSCQTVDDVRELARQLLVAGMSSEDKGKGDQWINMSRSCLSAYLVDAWVSGAGLTDALQALFVDQASGKALTDEQALFDYRMFQTVAAASSTVGSIMATIQGAIMPWLSDEVVGWLDCDRQFEMSNIRKEKAVVFLTTTAAEMKQSQAIQHVFFSQLFQYLAESGDGTRVQIIMDEMANLGRLEGIDQALNLLRSAGVALHGFIQNSSQIQAVYGKDQGDVVVESFGTICVMSGLRKDAENLSKLLGMKDAVRASHSTMDEHLRAQYAQNQESEMEANAIRQIQKNEVLIISGNCKPVIAKLRPWFKIKKLFSLVPTWARRDWKEIDLLKVAAVFQSFKVIEPQRLTLPDLATGSAGAGPKERDLSDKSKTGATGSSCGVGIGDLMQVTAPQPTTEEHIHDINREEQI